MISGIAICAPHYDCFRGAAYAAKSISWQWQGRGRGAVGSSEEVQALEPDLPNAKVGAVGSHAGDRRMRSSCTLSPLKPKRSRIRYADRRTPWASNGSPILRRHLRTIEPPGERLWAGPASTQSDSGAGWCGPEERPVSHTEAQRQSDDSATSICSEQAHPRQEFPSRDGGKSFALAPWLKQKFMPRTSVWYWS